MPLPTWGDDFRDCPETHFSVAERCFMSRAGAALLAAVWTTATLNLAGSEAPERSPTALNNLNDPDH